MKPCTPIHKFNKLGYSDKLDRSLPLAAAKVPDHRSDRPPRDTYVQVGYREFKPVDDHRVCRSAWDKKYGSPIPFVFTIDGAEFNKIQAWVYLTQGIGLSGVEAKEYLALLPLR